MFFLVNVSNAAVTTTVSFDPAELGFTKLPISAEIHSEEGKSHTVRLVFPTHEVTLPARSAQAWELTQPEK